MTMNESTVIVAETPLNESNIAKNRTPESPERFIHLLYAPTNFCNMGCQYCYLGKGTDEPTKKDDLISTLEFALKKFTETNTIPFNVSFHGGEATAIPKKSLEKLFEIATNHYNQYADTIKQSGYPLNPVHIKTNLYNFNNLYDLFVQYKVSVSGSVDLPLRLHGKYRTDKKGGSTLAKILENLTLLAGYPHHKKISCVITQEHFNHLDELIDDIKRIHYDIGLDMSKFNIMFSFDSEKNDEKFEQKIAGTEMLTQEQQVIVYQKLKEAFKGTELEQGFSQHWFKEFTPEFCCSAVNCGDKFFLLQSNGDVFACPRGQSSKKFFYGNLYELSVNDIQKNGWQTIESIENTLEADEECFTCQYLPHCNQGCVFVREQTQLTKSYTCQLQKEIYRDNPDRYPAYSDSYIQNYSKQYKYRNNLISFKKEELQVTQDKYITPELNEEKNALSTLIKKDEVLSEIYSESLFKLDVDGVEYDMRSPILSNIADVSAIYSDSKILLNVREDVFDINCTEPVNNYLQIMLLRNTLITYGDEARSKQEHIVDYSVYRNSFIAQSKSTSGYLTYDLTSFFRQHQSLFIEGVRNNIYMTTKTMREYHYAKQKKNAFYHIQAINLPFSFIEFYWKNTIPTINI